MFKSLIISLLLGISQTGTPPAPAVLLQQFMQEIVDKQVDESTLAQKYMCPSLLGRQGEKGEKMRLLFRTALASQREAIQKLRMDPKLLIINSFNDITVEHLEITGDTQQVYAAQYKGKIVCYFLMQEDRIESFTVMKKGDRGFFISYCE